MNPVILRNFKRPTTFTTHVDAFGVFVCVMAFEDQRRLKAMLAHDTVVWPKWLVHVVFLWTSLIPNPVLLARCAWEFSITGEVLFRTPLASGLFFERYLASVANQTATCSIFFWH